MDPCANQELELLAVIITGLSTILGYAVLTLFIVEGSKILKKLIDLD